jgi:DNA-binding transcriptional MerR regulator/methanogenic corrinoid protein MtbC1
MPRYRIKAVSRLTGVRPELLRMWEKRYHLFKPQRADNRYREFDDDDVRLLIYIRQQLEQGRAIGELAAEGREALLRRLSPPPDSAAPPREAPQLIDELVAYAQCFDKMRLDTRLAECVAQQPFGTVLHTVFVPLLHRLGDLWAAQQLPMASERLVTVTLTQRLLTLLQATAPGTGAPLLLCACPSGERHELGLLTFAYRMQQSGWQVYYLGSDLPLQELHQSCQHLQPTLVALSLTHVTDASHCLALIHDIDALIAATYPTWVGGQAVEAYGHLIHPRHVSCFPSLQTALSRAGQWAPPPAPVENMLPALGKIAVSQ